MNEHPSPFYTQLEPTSNFQLEYPFFDVDFSKLQFNGLSEQADRVVAKELVSLVDLGGRLFRLAEKMDELFLPYP